LLLPMMNCLRWHSWCKDWFTFSLIALWMD
jgi:hypothetical protein